MKGTARSFDCGGPPEGVAKCRCDVAGAAVGTAAAQPLAMISRSYARQRLAMGPLDGYDANVTAPRPCRNMLRSSITAGELSTLDCGLSANQVDL